MKHLSDRRLNGAMAAYQTFQSKESKRQDVHKVNLPDEVYQIGKASEIMYRSGKWMKGRKTQDYYHVHDSKPYVYHEDGEGRAKSVSSLIGPYNKEQIPLAALGYCLGLEFYDMDGELVELSLGSRKPLLCVTPDMKTLVILGSKPVFIRGGKMRVEGRGIVA